MLSSSSSTSLQSSSSFSDVLVSLYCVCRPRCRRPCLARECGRCRWKNTISETCNRIILVNLADRPSSFYYIALIHTMNNSRQVREPLNSRLWSLSHPYFDEQTTSGLLNWTKLHGVNQLDSIFCACDTMQCHYFSNTILPGGGGRLLLVTCHCTLTKVALPWCYIHTFNLRYFSMKRD